VRILLLEDEDSIRNALLRAFERDGHDVRAASSISAAREHLVGWSPELAVSDLKLPDGDGLDLVGSLGVPVIMLSGYATYDDAVRALRFGAVDFFTKPVAIKDIRSAITRAHRPGGQPTVPTWSNPDEAIAAVRSLVSRLPGRVSRLAAAELVQAAPVGRLVAHIDEHGVRMWLDGAVDWVQQGDRRTWLESWGVAVASGPSFGIAFIEVETACIYDDQSELLWPEELVVGRVVLASRWVTTGSWLAASLRAGVGPLAGVSTDLQRHLYALGVSIQTAPEALAQPGVGAAERGGLLSGDDLGAPIA